MFIPKILFAPVSLLLSLFVWPCGDLASCKVQMRRYYCTFPIRSTVWSELSWSHYRLLMRVPDEKARTFYAEECAKSAWSVRQLERRTIGGKVKQVPVIRYRSDQ